MKIKTRHILINVAICTIGACVLTSCYTVKGAFQGAGKDVSVLVGPPSDGHHYHHRVVTKKSVTNNGQTTSTTTTTQSTQPTTIKSTTGY